MPNNVPANAIEVVFKYGRSMDGTYHVWKTENGKWQWQAFGNCGEESTQERAIDAARNWIMYDYDALTSWHVEFRDAKSQSKSI